METRSKTFHNRENRSPWLRMVMENRLKACSNWPYLRKVILALGRNRESRWLAGCQIVSTLPSSTLVIFQSSVYLSPRTEAAKKIETGRAHRSVVDSSFQTLAGLYFRLLEAFVKAARGRIGASTKRRGEERALPTTKLTTKLSKT